MQAHEGHTRIVTDEFLRETIPHGSEEYPFRYYLEDIWQFDFHCIEWHWHPEVEFVLIQKGTADFLIGSERYALGAGTGLFINSQVIHRFEAAESVIIPNIVFSPSLIAPEDSLIYRKYVQSARSFLPRTRYRERFCARFCPCLTCRKTGMDVRSRRRSCF